MSHPLLSERSLSLIEADIQTHRLPGHFLDTVTDYYWPLCRQIQRNSLAGRCRVIGIQGSQGSGKSTCAAFVKTILESEFQLKVLVASIDDFYLTLTERRDLSESIHPLLLTRGVPGTHDIDLIEKLFNEARKGELFSVPSFSKAVDDRAVKADWPTHIGPFDIVILEGWCVGVPAQDQACLAEPVNDLERREDADQRWRKFVNNALATEYLKIFDQLDMLVSLQAPSFDCVYQWRQLQEQKLIDALEAAGQSTAATMNPDEISRFISHYQRLTEHALTILEERADVVLYLNQNHSFTHISGIEL